MSYITLVRHGQANSAAVDEVSYDRLSDLGRQQAEWLGAHMRETRSFHHRVYCGTLTRHVETAQAMGVDADIVRDARLNELEYFTLSQLWKRQTGSDATTPDEFVTHLPRLFEAWSRDAIDGAPESFSAFERRVREALDEIMAGEGPALVVTSGGLIAMAMRQMMGLDIEGMARMALAIMNTSVHRVHPIGGHLSPVMFNAVPHLEAPDRQHAQTHF